MLSLILSEITIYSHGDPLIGVYVYTLLFHFPLVFVNTPDGSTFRCRCSREHIKHLRYNLDLYR